MMHENDSLFVLLIPLWSSTLLKAIPFYVPNFMLIANKVV